MKTPLTRIVGADLREIIPVIDTYVQHIVTYRRANDEEQCIFGWTDAERILRANQSRAWSKTMVRPEQVRRVSTLKMIRLTDVQGEPFVLRNPFPIKHHELLYELRQSFAIKRL